MPVMNVFFIDKRSSTLLPDCSYAIVVAGALDTQDHYIREAPGTDPWSVAVSTVRVADRPSAPSQGDARRWPARHGCPGRLLFSALFTTALAEPTNEPSDHERGQQERDDHAHADEHIGENESGAVLDGHGARTRSASMPLYGQWS